MKKFMGASLLLLVISALQTNAFAGSLNCAFKNAEVRVEGIETLQISDEALVVNQNGVGGGLQIILKSCTDEAALEGHLIDAANAKVAEVVCDEVTP